RAKSLVLNDCPFSHVPRNGGVPVKRAGRTAAGQSLRKAYSVAVGLSQAWLTTTCAVAEAEQPPFVVTVTLMSTAFVPLGVIVTVSPSALAGVAFAIVHAAVEPGGSATRAVNALPVPTEPGTLMSTAGRMQSMWYDAFARATPQFEALPAAGAAA